MFRYRKRMSTQLKLVEMLDNFQLKDWKNRLRHLLRAHGQMQWDIGDHLIEGEDQGKLAEADLKRHALAATQNRWAWKTLRNFKVTARAIPPSRRRDGHDGRREVSYSIHAEIAKFKDAETQERLLEMAATGWSLAPGADYLETARFTRKDGSEDFRAHVQIPMTVEDLKARIKDMQNKGELPATKRTAPPEPDKPKPWKRDRVVPVKFTSVHHDFLKAALSVRPYDAGGITSVRDFVYKLTCDYIQQNFEILMEYAKKHDVRWGTHLRPELSQLLSHQKYPEVAPPPLSPAKLKREEKKRAESLAAQAVQAEKDRIAEKEGRPTRLQFQGYATRCAKLTREVLSKAGNGSGGLFMPYLRKIFAVKDILPETTSVVLWESTLAKLENASSPQALVEILKS